MAVSSSNKTKIFTEETGILAKLSKQDRYNLIGQITSLLLASELHRKYLINDIGAVFLPAIHLNQFRIYRNREGDPVGLITWAYMSKEIEAKYLSGKYTLKLEDWHSGNEGWVIDFLAPFGHTKSIIKDLRENVFPGQKGKAVRVRADGSKQAIWKFQAKRNSSQ